MKKFLEFSNLFFVFAVIFAISAGWNIYSCIILAIASIWMLVEIVPQIIKEVRRGKKDKTAR